MKFRDKSGQGMVEYIIIVVVVALAALAIFGLLGDTIRGKTGSAIAEMGGDQDKVDEALQESGVDKFKNLDSSTVGGG